MDEGPLFWSGGQNLVDHGCIASELARPRADLGNDLLASRIDIWSWRRADGQRRGLLLVCDPRAREIFQCAAGCPTRADRDERWTVSLDSTPVLYGFTDYHARAWNGIHQLAVSHQCAADRLYWI